MFWQRMRTGLVFQLGAFPLILALSAGTVQAASTSTPVGPSAEIVLHVPPSAAVWVDGIRSQYSGVERRFLTPPLTPGDRYVYDVRAVWTAGGQLIDRRRQLSFRAGDRVVLDFPPDGRVATIPGTVETVAPAAVQTSYYYSPTTTTTTTTAAAVVAAPVQRSYYYTPVATTTYTPVAPVTPVYTYPLYVQPVYVSPSYIPTYPTAIMYR